MSTALEIAERYVDSAAIRASAQRMGDESLREPLLEQFRRADAKRRVELFMQAVRTWSTALQFHHHGCPDADCVPNGREALKIACEGYLAAVRELEA